MTHADPPIPSAAHPAPYALTGYLPPDARRPRERRIGRLAVVTAILLIAVGGLLVTGALGLFRLARLAEGWESAEVADADLVAAAELAGLVELETFGAYVITGIVFLMWTAAVVRNARILEPAIAPSIWRAVLGWILPLFNFVTAASTLARVDRASLPSERRSWTAALVWCWATAFALGSLMTVYTHMVLGSVYNGLADFTSYVWVARLDAQVRLTLAVAVALAIVIVLRITRRQQAALRRRADLPNAQRSTRTG